MTIELEQQNMVRDEFNLNKFQSAIQNALVNEMDKGILNSILFRNHLIDYYIPFMPLKINHVKKCIKSEFEKHKFYDEFNNEENLIDLVADKMSYESIGNQRISSSGCKRLDLHVRQFIVEKRKKLKIEF
jgi:hypothetical protein